MAMRFFRFFELLLLLLGFACIVRLLSVPMDFNLQIICGTLGLIALFVDAVCFLAEQRLSELIRTEWPEDEHTTPSRPQSPPSQPQH
ncbi:MAG: hypothetical protein WBO92_02855 [Candidatus Moraniibacteriota bacterium]